MNPYIYYNYITTPKLLYFISFPPSLLFNLDTLHNHSSWLRLVSPASFRPNIIRFSREMNTIAKRVTGIMTRTSHNNIQLQQERGIRVKVFKGDLDKALTILQKKMVSSGMERLIKATQTHHIKNSEKKVLARKNLERRIKSIDFARKLQSILIKKVRGL